MGDGCHGKAWNAWNAWKWREAQGQLSVLRQRSQEASLIAINRALSYITKLPTCRKTWRLSTATLSSLRSRALRPDVVSETISLTACHRGSAWSFALQLGFFCSQRRGDAIYALEVLRSATWTWQRAAKVLERMEDDGLRLDAKHGAVMAAALSWCSWCRAQEEIQSEEAKPVEDWHFEWLEGKDVGTLEPLLPYDDLKQPDDEQDPPERPRGLCCFCGGTSRVRA